MVQRVLLKNIMVERPLSILQVKRRLDVQIQHVHAKSVHQQYGLTPETKLSAGTGSSSQTS